MQSPTLDGYKDQILEFGRKHRLAVFANFAIGGAVLSYGPNVADMIARATHLRGQNSPRGKTRRFAHTATHKV